MTEADIEKLQSRKLTEDEFNFCKKLFEKIQKMDYMTKDQRKLILDSIEGQLKKSKFDFKIEEFDGPDEQETYSLFINNKQCFIVFDIIGKNPPNIIPSGVIDIGTN